MGVNSCNHFFKSGEIGGADFAALFMESRGLASLFNIYMLSQYKRSDQAWDILLQSYNLYLADF